jgi:hypothetical protein
MAAVNAQAPVGFAQLDAHTATFAELASAWSELYASRTSTRRCRTTERLNEHLLPRIGHL